MANKDTAKQWFEKGDKPTQAQFAQVFEWLRWKDEAIVVASDDLKLDKTIFDAYEQGTPIIFDGDGPLIIDANYLLERLIVLPPIDAPAVMIGDTDGGDEISPETPIVSAKGGVIEVNVFAKGGARTIYLSGIPVDTVIVPLKRKIKTA